MSPLQFLGGIPGPGAIIYKFPFRAINPEELEAASGTLKTLQNLKEYASRTRNYFNYTKGMDKTADRFHELIEPIASLTKELESFTNKPIRRGSDDLTGIIERANDLVANWNGLNKKYSKLMTSQLGVAQKPLEELDPILADLLQGLKIPPKK